MKDCQNYGDDCSKCGAKELCDALTNLLEVLSTSKPKIPSDDVIREQTMEYVHHVGRAAFNEAYAKELFKELDFDIFHGLILASMHTLSDVYLSWEDKCEQIDALKVQLDALEALHEKSV